MFSIVEESAGCSKNGHCSDRCTIFHLIMSSPCSAADVCVAPQPSHGSTKPEQQQQQQRQQHQPHHYLHQQRQQWRRAAEQDQPIHPWPPPGDHRPGSGQTLPAVSHSNVYTRPTSACPSPKKAYPWRLQHRFGLSVFTSTWLKHKGDLLSGKNGSNLDTNLRILVRPRHAQLFSTAIIHG